MLLRDDALTDWEHIVKLTAFNENRHQEDDNVRDVLPVTRSILTKAGSELTRGNVLTHVPLECDSSLLTLSEGIAAAERQAR